MKKSHATKLRNRLVYRVCTFLIDHVASPDYRRFIRVILFEGREALDAKIKNEGKTK